jgi:DNA-binding PadR family transcriptional regulator
MPLPDITHLQFLLLTALLDGERPGRELRTLLESEGHKKSGPAFYQLMARMEDAKLVKGRYEQKVVEGQIIKERVYTVTGAGTAAVADVQEFYAGLAARRSGLEGGLNDA